MINKDFILTASDNEKLNITAYGLDHAGGNPCIIVVHGFKGFKDWGFFPYTGRYLAEKGFFVITFNFSHNGIGENKMEFTEEQKFAENTFSREISELSEVIEAYRKGFFGNTNGRKIGLLGHSRGGAIALLTASVRKDVDAVALWASVAKLDRYSERQKKDWREKGYLQVKNARTGQIMRMNSTLLDDIDQNGSGILNIRQAVKQLRRPLLIAHGDQDLAVPVREAEELYKWTDKEKTELFKLYNTGHTFDIVHPFESSSEKLERLLEKTASFFTNNLL